MLLNDFYNATLETLGLSMDEEGFVVQPDGEENARVLIGKRFLVMPTSEHVSTMTDEKVLFNPLQEDAIKGINPSMVKLEAMQERKLSIAFNTVQFLLAKLAADVKLQAKASLELNKFISELNVLRKAQMKEIVTENTLKLLNKIHTASYKKNSSAGSVAIKIDKSVVLDGEKFSKVASIVLPIYAEVLAAMSSTSDKKYIYDIDVTRPTDLGILKLTTEFIIGKDEEGKVNTYKIGSNSTESPTFISVYKVYVKLSTRLNKLLASLSFIDKTICDAVKINHVLKVDDLVHIENFKSSLRLIPKIDLNSSVSIPKITNTTTTMPGYASPTNVAAPATTYATRPAAPTTGRPMTAMERKLAQIRGTLPTETPAMTGFGGGFGSMAAAPVRQVVTVRNPGARPTMTREQLAILNMAIAPVVPAVQMMPQYAGANYGQPAGNAGGAYRPFYREGPGRF